MPRLDVSSPPERLAPGCTRITLPDPFVPGVTSVFLLEDETGTWLLDAGADTQASVTELRFNLAAIGLDEAALDGVVLSHTHLDHAGGLLRWTPQRLVAHESAATEMRNLSPRSSRGPSALRRMGVPEQDIRELAPDGEPVAADSPLSALRIDSTLRGAEGAFDGALPSWSWVLAGGHAPGHVLLYNATTGVLLAGDQFMVKWKTPYLISDPEQDSYGEYLSSIDRCRELDLSMICSSHTIPILDPGPWLLERREALLHKSERTADAVRGGATTAWEAMFAAYPRIRPGGLRVILLREQMAILRHLAADGTLVRAADGGVERYAPS